ncbi:MAG: response regulator [Dehalococcoidia bacterium]|nr:MAG: response regulator [Dehalococcoidia bacterium]
MVGRERDQAIFMDREVRVLIVEDDSLVCEMIEGLLEDIKYTVVGKATDGRRALELAQALRPDVVLMDIEMPHMNGLEATRHIYECCPTPVVILTAYENSELLAQASAAGVGAYLVKPPNKRQVERALVIAMARFNDLMTLRQLNEELQTRNQELQTALAQVKTLSGLLPICSSCKKIRNDQGYWQQVEIYIAEHSEAEFSHGLCSDCMLKLYPDTYEKSLQRKQDIINVLTRRGQADLKTIAAGVGLPESNTLNRLENMITEGQVRRLKENDQTLYELKNS